MDEDLPDKQPDQDDMHACQDLSDDDVVDIGGNCARVVENFEEMVCDTMENDDDIDGEQLVIGWSNWWLAGKSITLRLGVERRRQLCMGDGDPSFMDNLP